MIRKDRPDNYVMDNLDTNRRIEGALKTMRSERPADPLWADRVWSGIETKLGRPPGLSDVLWGTPALRWAAVATCLVLAFGWTLQQRHSKERDLGAYVAGLYEQSAASEVESIAEPILLSGGASLQPVGYYEEGSDADPSVYDVLLEM